MVEKFTIEGFVFYLTYIFNYNNSDRYFLYFTHENYSGVARQDNLPREREEEHEDVGHSWRQVLRAL